MNLKKATLPNHVAILMDGNRRWAKKKGLSAIGGHNYVVDEVIEPLVDRCIELGIPYLTLWAFSTENWNRDKAEVEGLMKLFRRAMLRKVEDLFKKGAKLNMIGDLSKFPEDIAKKAREWIEVSKDNHAITVTFALNYGGRDEIIRATRRIISSGQWATPEGGQAGDSGQLQEENFARYLDTAALPDVDLIIRTGGQYRLSGFMPWQSVYSELYFTDTLMPEMTVDEFDKALTDFQRRQRRFGK